jgi:hypothetical protein
VVIIAPGIALTIASYCRFESQPKKRPPSYRLLHDRRTTSTLPDWFRRIGAIVAPCSRLHCSCLAALRQRTPDVRLLAVMTLPWTLASCDNTSRPSTASGASKLAGQACRKIQLRVNNHLSKSRLPNI